jgi:hypothetical protein
MRQRANIAVQRDTAQILNTKAYLESYADYLEKLIPTLNVTEQDNLRTNPIDFDGITGTATNIVDEIIDLADFGSPKNYTFGGDIYVEWNKCPGTSKGDLYANNVLYNHDDIPANVCAEGEVYDDIIGPITVANPTIETLNNPFLFRITAKNFGTVLEDNDWYINLEMDLGYGNKVTVNRTF